MFIKLTVINKSPTINNPVIDPKHTLTKSTLQIDLKVRKMVVICFQFSYFSSKG